MRDDLVRQAVEIKRDPTISKPDKDRLEEGVADGLDELREVQRKVEGGPKKS